MDVQTVLREKLSCPTLHSEMVIVLADRELTAGKLALELLKANGLTRNHLTTKEFELLKQRLKRSAHSNNSFSARVEIIEKNQQTIISRCQ